MNEVVLLSMFVGFLLFFFLTGYPVGYAMGLTSVLLMLFGVGRGVSAELIMSRMYFGLNSFTLLAIPFFLFAGRIMNVGGMTTRIFDFSNAMVGSLKGGLGHVNVLASMIFAGMSGLATADAAGLGAIEYKAMKDGGYPERYAIGLAGASATIGAIFPPSVPTVLYAIVGHLSVGWMLLGGILPGIMIGVILMVVVTLQSHFGKLPRGERFSMRRVTETFGKGFLALLTPVILIVGIMSGVFTPTEAAAVTAIYALVLALFAYRELSWKGLWEVISDTAIDATVVTVLIGMASIYGYLVIQSRIPVIFAERILALTQNPLIVMILINVFLLVIGMFLETFAIITIMTPILLPLINQIGIDPIHFGIVMIFNLQIGLLTPPFGIVLFVLNKATGLEVSRIIKGMVPYYLPLVVCLVVLILFPQLTLWIPRMVFAR